MRVTKVVATGLFCDCQCSAYLNIVGNTFDPFFFSPRSSGRNLYILRLHIRVTGRMGELSELRELERPVTENDIRKCSNVYLRVRMVKSTPSSLECESIRYHDRHRVSPNLRRVRIPKKETYRLVREREDSTSWRILGTIGAGPERELHIHRLGVDY